MPQTENLVQLKIPKIGLEYKLRQSHFTNDIKIALLTFLSLKFRCAQNTQTSHEQNQRSMCGCFGCAIQISNRQQCSFHTRTMTQNVTARWQLSFRWALLCWRLNFKSVVMYVCDYLYYKVAKEEKQPYSSPKLRRTGNWNGKGLILHDSYWPTFKLTYLFCSILVIFKLQICFGKLNFGRLLCFI